MISALIGAGASLASSTVNALSQSAQNRQNYRYAKEMQQRNDRFQRNLMIDTPSLNKQGYRAAGMSAAGMNGFETASSNATGAAPQGIAPQFDAVSAANLYNQSLLAQKQSSLLESQTEGVDLENEAKALELENSKNTGRHIYLKFEKYLNELGARKMEEFKAKHPNASQEQLLEIGFEVLPNFFRSSKYMTPESFTGLTGNFDNKVQAAKTEKMELEQNEAMASFIKDVTNSQHFNPKVFLSLVNEPLYAQLLKKSTITLNGSMTTLNRKLGKKAEANAQKAYSDIQKNASEIGLNEEKIKEMQFDNETRDQLKELIRYSEKSKLLLLPENITRRIMDGTATDAEIAYATAIYLAKSGMGAAAIRAAGDVGKSAIDAVTLGTGNVGKAAKTAKKSTPKKK